MSQSKLNAYIRPCRLLALLALAATVLAACGSPDGSPAGGGPGPSGSAGSSPAAHSPAADGPVPEPRPTALGVIVTDGQGFTLYAFGADRGTMPPCATAWPVIIPAAGVTVAGGAEQSLAGTITRAGGARQVTYAGHPLYRYAGDVIPGAVTGQGSDAFGARWDVLTPAGTEVTSAAPLRAAEVS
jgi:predicted lipoprotein with Yx(FWY)xxD motif